MQDKCNLLCYRCKHFQRYYTQGQSEYQATKIGRCCKGHGTVNGSDGCEEFVYRQRPRHISNVVKFRLNNLFTELTMIRNILEEEWREINGQKNV